VTPPALARISGTTKMFFSARMSSATMVVGPLAPSQRIRHWSCAAFLLVMTFSVAAGMRISHSRVISSAESTASASLKPAMAPVWTRWRRRALMSRPLALKRPPPDSAMPTMR
jgi:hypothetical protein